MVKMTTEILILIKMFQKTKVIKIYKRIIDRNMYSVRKITINTGSSPI